MRKLISEMNGTKLHNEELCDLYSLPSTIRIIKSRRMRWVENVAQMEKKRVAYLLPEGKPHGKRPLGRPRCRWIDKIEMDLLEMELGGVDWNGLVQDRYRWRTPVNMVTNLRVP
jgi:hypothetical protein